MKCTVIGNIKAAGKPLKRGAEIDLDDADAERLARDGYVAPVLAADVAPKADDKKAAAKADDKKGAAK